MSKEKAFTRKLVIFYYKYLLGKSLNAWRSARQQRLKYEKIARELQLNHNGMLVASAFRGFREYPRIKLQEQIFERKAELRIRYRTLIQFLVACSACPRPTAEEAERTATGIEG